MMVARRPWASIRGGGGLDVAAVADPGVVVQDVDPAVGVVDGLGEGLDGGRVADVHGVGFGTAAGLADLPGHRLSGVGIEVGEVYLGSAGG
jgi:hypothetical protein